MKTTNATTYAQPAAGGAGGPQMHNSAAALKNSAFKMAAKGTTGFATNNQIAYKWVQPQFAD